MHSSYDLNCMLLIAVFHVEYFSSTVSTIIGAYYHEFDFLTFHPAKMLVPLIFNFQSCTVFALKIKSYVLQELKTIPLRFTSSCIPKSLWRHYQVTCLLVHVSNNLKNCILQYWHQPRNMLSPPCRSSD